MTNITPKKFKPTRTSISLEDARELLEAYDHWVGSLCPCDREEYLSRFDSLRNRLNRLDKET